MESFFDWITQLPQYAIQSLGTIVVFLAVVLEPIPPFVMMIPGQKITILSGFLARIEVFSLPMVLIYIFIGTWIGDIFSYFTGKKYGLPLLKRYGKYVRISDETLEKIQQVVKKNLGLGTILLKFGLTRGLLPFIAGSFKINFKKMFIYTGISSLLWVVSCVLLGYVLGTSYELVAAYVGKIITRGIIAGICSLVLFTYFKSEYNIFKKWFSWLMLGNVFSVVLFSVIAQRLYQDKLSFVAFDTRIQNLLTKSPFVDTLVLGINQIFNFWWIGIIGLVIIIYLYRNKLIYHLTVFASSMLSAGVAFPIIKMLIQRARPGTSLILLKDYSFPSGHATVSLVVCLLCRYVLQGQIKRPWVRYSFLVLMIILAAGIGTSRIFLYVHRFTDVIAGFLLGFFILTTNILVWKIFFNIHIEQRKVININSKKSLIDALL